MCWKSCEFQGQMMMQDRLEKEKADAKNAVEEYVYEMRDKLSGQLENFMKEADRDAFRKQLTDTEDWLYDEGEDQGRKVYTDKLAELKVATSFTIMKYYHHIDVNIATYCILSTSPSLTHWFPPDLLHPSLLGPPPSPTPTHVCTQILSSRLYHPHWCI